MKQISMLLLITLFAAPAVAQTKKKSPPSTQKVEQIAALAQR